MNILKFNDFEIVSLAGVTALVGDLIWLCHDLIVNGFSITYLVVAIGLLIGIIGTFLALHRHYHRNVKTRPHKASKQGDADREYWLNH